MVQTKVLHFGICLLIAVERLRINILPLITETSDTSGDKGTYMITTHPKAQYGKLVQAEQRTLLQDLRYNITKALNNLFCSFPETIYPRRPETGSTEPAEQSKSHFIDGPPPSNPSVGYDDEHKVIVKNLYCKKNFCKYCHLDIFGSVFPFEDSARATLDNFRYVLHHKDKCEGD
jgi:hypothetical protein